MGNAYSDHKVCKCLELEDQGLFQRQSQSVGDERFSKSNTSRANSAATSFKASDIIMKKVTTFGDLPHSGRRLRSHSQTIEIEAKGATLGVKCAIRGDNDALICKRERGSKTSGLGMTRQGVRVFSESSSETVLKSDESTSSSVKSSSALEGQLFKALLDLERLSLRSNHTMDSNEITESKEKSRGDEDINCIPKHVLYYGWFFTPETSSVINAVVMHFFTACYNQVNQFQRFIFSCCKDADIRDPFEYYKRPGKRVKSDDEIKYHVTVKLMFRNPDTHYQPLVQPFLKKVFRIYLVGIVFTPKSLGVRIKLTPAQKLIFDEKDEYRTGKRLSRSEDDVSSIQSQIQEELNSYNQPRRKGNPHCKLKSHDRSRNDKVFYKPSKIPLPSDPPVTTSRAHITIGIAPKVKPKQTGDDLVDIIDLEQRPVQIFSRISKLSMGFLDNLADMEMHLCCTLIWK